MNQFRSRQRRAAVWSLNAILGNPKASPVEIRTAAIAVIRADLEAESGMTDIEIARSTQFESLETRLQSAFISSRRAGG